MLKEKASNQIGQVPGESRPPGKTVLVGIWLTLLLVLLVLIPGSAAAATGTKYIRDDSKGGDCGSIGNWDSSTKTCTLTADLDFSGTHGIQIAANGITFNGNGHTLTGTPSTPWRAGVYMQGKSNAVVKNLTIKQFNFGIRLVDSTGVTITGNSTSANFQGISLRNSAGNTLFKNIASTNSYFGIFLDDSTGNMVEDNAADSNSSSGIFLYGSTGKGSTGNTLSGNTASGNSYDGITIETPSINNTIIGNMASANSWYGIFTASDGNTISGNTFSSGRTGMFLYSSSSNTISGNTLSANSDNGIILWDYTNDKPSSNNKIYRNNFLNNSRQVYVYGGLGNLFNLPAPVGGNYWSDYSSPDKGCGDADNDGFCDTPYLFTGGQDDLPRITPTNCGKPRISVVSKTLKWGSYMDFVNRKLTASYVIKNSSDVGAFSVNVASSKSDKKVGMLSALPLSLADMPPGATVAFELYYKIPLTVTAFHTTTTLAVQDECRNDFRYGYEYNEAVPVP